MLDKIVAAIQGASAIVVVIAIAMLFLNSPTAAPEPPPVAAAAIEEIAPAVDATALYTRRCAGCHGGDGSGGIGPPLKSARMLERFADPTAQQAIITDGQGGMPSFGTSLSVEEIEALVEYTRTSLP